MPRAPPAPAFPAPSEDDWNAHKDTIRRIYLERTLKDLISYMQKEHKFIASKNQYERRLLDWNCRKNLNNDEWNFVLCRKRVREEMGKESQFAMYGLEISEKKIKKEHSRYTISQLNDMHQQSLYCNPKTPEGISVQTPQPDHQEILHPQSPHTSLIRIHHVQPQTALRLNGDSNHSPIPDDTFIHDSPVSGNAQMLSSPLPATPSASQTYIGPIQTPEEVHDYAGLPSSPTFCATYYEQPITLPENLNVDNFEFSQDLVRFSPSASISGIGGPLQNTLVGAVSTSYLSPPRVISKEKLMRNLPFFQYLDFIRSQDPGFILALLSKDTEASEYMSYSKPFLDSSGTIFDNEDTSWDLELSTHSRFIVEPFPARFLQVQYHHFARTFLTSPIHLETSVEKLRNKLGTLMLERNLGDLDLMIQRLSGPADVDSVMEFLNLLAYVSSNSLVMLEDHTSILNWVVSQKKAVVEMMITVPLPTIRAFFQVMIEAASSTLNKEAVKYLLSADKQRIIYSGHREHLLYIAVEINAIDLARQLLKEMAIRDEDMNESVYEKAFTITCLGAARSVEMAVLLLEAGAKVNAEYGFRTPIRQAILNRDLKLVALLLRWGADPNDKKLYPSNLSFAVYHGDASTLSLLLKAGAKPVNNYRKSGMEPDYGERDEMVYFICEMENELHLAASKGFTNIVELLLAHQPIINELRTGKGRWAPLRDAAKNGSLDVVKKLVEAGADVNASSKVTVDAYFTRGPGVGVDILPSTALIAAVEGGHLKVVKYLLSCQAEINALAFSKSGTSVVEVARTLGHSDIEQYLVENGGIESPPCSANQAVLALQIAACRKDLKRCRSLVADGLDPICLVTAMRVGYEGGEQISRRKLRYRKLATRNILTAFLEIYQGDLNKDRIGAECLEIALESDHFSAALNLSLANVSIDEIDLSLGRINLECFCGIGCRRIGDFIPIAEQENLQMFLLRMYTNTENRDFLDRALQLSAWRLDLPRMRYLVSRGADVNAEPWTNGANALQLALNSRFWSDGHDEITKGFIETIRFLLEIGANINDPPSRCPKGNKIMNSFQQAARLDHRVFRLLLEYGPDINVPAHRYTGRTALQAAVEPQNPSLETIQILLEKGADVNAPPAHYGGITALQGAAVGGHIKVALLLLESGADPNSPVLKGLTALEVAARGGHLDMVQLLLNAGAHPSENAARGAEHTRHFVVADLIREELKRQRFEEETSDEEDSEDVGDESDSR